MLWKSNLWPNLLWYHEEPVSSNHCNPWHGRTACFPRALVHRSLGAVSRQVCTFGLLHCQIWGIIYRQLSDHFCYSFKMKVERAVLLRVEVNLFCRRSLPNRLVWNVWEGKWDAINTGQFSVRVVIAVYLLIARSPCLWQRLGCNQLTGWVVRGVTCLNNLAPVWAEVSWANSQRAKLAGFWNNPFESSLLSFKEKKQDLLWCVSETRTANLALQGYRRKEGFTGQECTNNRLKNYESYS